MASKDRQSAIMRKLGFAEDLKVETNHEDLETANEQANAQFNDPNN